jgi:SAM-dependent methyltransferase
MTEWAPDAFGQSHADLYDALLGNVPDTAETVEYFSRYAGQSLLELGSGTGRPAIPLAEAGLSVTAIEASERMIEAMRRKPGGKTVRVHQGDFTRLDLEDRFDHILLSRNTLLALPDQDLQIATIRAASEHLATGGRIYIDLGMPDPSATTKVQYGGVIDEGVILIQRTHDRLRQLVELKRIVLGAETSVLQYLSRYVWPAELDLMGRLAGLDLVDRWSDWQKTPFRRPVGAFISVFAQPAPR